MALKSSARCAAGVGETPGKQVGSITASWLEKGEVRRTLDEVDACELEAELDYGRIADEQLEDNHRACPICSLVSP
jgi:hypothetical protein